MKSIEKDEWRVHRWVELGSISRWMGKLQVEKCREGNFLLHKEFAGEQVQNKEVVRSLHSFQICLALVELLWLTVLK